MDDNLENKARAKSGKEKLRGQKHFKFETQIGGRGNGY